MTIGNRISSARKNKGLTQEYLAEQLGVSRQAVSKWETDQSAPDTRNLIALASLLNVSVEYLATGKQNEPSEPTDRNPAGLLWSIALWLWFGGVVLYLFGIISGLLNEMVIVWVNRVGIGIPFLMYGTSGPGILLTGLLIVMSIAVLVLLIVAAKLDK